MKFPSDSDSDIEPRYQARGAELASSSSTIHSLFNDSSHIAVPDTSVPSTSSSRKRKAKSPPPSEQRHQKRNTNTNLQDEDAQHEKVVLSPLAGWPLALDQVTSSLHVDRLTSPQREIRDPSMTNSVPPKLDEMVERLKRKVDTAVLEYQRLLSGFTIARDPPASVLEESNAKGDFQKKKTIPSEPPRRHSLRMTSLAKSGHSISTSPSKPSKKSRGRKVANSRKHKKVTELVMPIPSSESSLAGSVNAPRDRPNHREVIDLTTIDDQDQSRTRSSTPYYQHYSSPKLRRFEAEVVEPVIPMPSFKLSLAALLNSPRNGHHSQNMLPPKNYIRESTISPSPAGNILDLMTTSSEQIISSGFNGWGQNHTGTPVPTRPQGQHYSTNPPQHGRAVTGSAIPLPPFQSLLEAAHAPRDGLHIQDVLRHDYTRRPTISLSPHTSSSGNIIDLVTSPSDQVNSGGFNDQRQSRTSTPFPSRQQGQHYVSASPQQYEETAFLSAPYPSRTAPYSRYSSLEAGVSARNPISSTTNATEHWEGSNSYASSELSATRPSYPSTILRAAFW